MSSSTPTPHFASSKSNTTQKTTIPPPPEGTGAHFRTILDDVRKTPSKNNNNTKSTTTNETGSMTATNWTSSDKIRSPLQNRLPGQSSSSSAAKTPEPSSSSVASAATLSPSSVNRENTKNNHHHQPPSVPRLARKKILFNENEDDTTVAIANSNQRSAISDDITVMNDNLISSYVDAKPTSQSQIHSMVFRNNSLNNNQQQQQQQVTKKDEDSSAVNKSRRSEAFMRSVLMADSPAEWNNSNTAESKKNSMSNTSNIKQQQSNLPPWIPQKVSETFFALKKELGAIAVEEQENSRFHQILSQRQGDDEQQQDPSFESIEACLRALETLAEVTATPVFKPIFDLISSTLQKHFSSSKTLIHKLTLGNNTSAQVQLLKEKLDSVMKSHYTDILTERKRTKDANERIKQLQQEFVASEEEWKIKIIDANSDKKRAELQLQEIVDEIDELREDRNALMSVRKSQEAHVKEVEAKAANVIEEAERQVGITKEDLTMKIKTIRELKAEMEGAKMRAKKEFDEYAARALPPQKSSALRAEADRYKAEVKKLKERVEKLVAELQKREAYEPAVQWEDFIEEDVLMKFCRVTEVPFLTRDERKQLLLGAAGGTDEKNGAAGTNAIAAAASVEIDQEALLADEEATEELLNKVSNRSSKFTKLLYDLWKSTKETLVRYEAERDLFRKVSQTFFYDVPGVNRVGTIPLHLLRKLAGPESVSASNFFQKQLLARKQSQDDDGNENEANTSNNNNASEDHHESSSFQPSSSRLHLDCPPIDSSSPEPWIDPAWVGCFVQAPPEFTKENAQNNFPDAPVLCKAEHRFQIVNVVIPPCLMSIHQVKSICVSALVLLGLNRVPERCEEGWHPARHFSHAIRLQLDAAVQDVKNLASNPIQGNLPPAAAANNNMNVNAQTLQQSFEKSFAAGSLLGSSMLNFNASLMASGSAGAKDQQQQHDYNAQEQLRIYSDIQHHLRRRFVLPMSTSDWDSEIDLKSTSAACMTVFAHRLQEFAPQDPLLELCHSFLLGKRPVLQHARYFALNLRYANHLFSRIEKMLKGSALGGSLPSALFVQALKPAFSVADTTDLTRLALSVFHTHYWIQICENRKTQMDVIAPGHEHVETEEEREEAEHMKKTMMMASKDNTTSTSLESGGDDNNMMKKFASKSSANNILDQVLASVANAKKTVSQLQNEKDQLEGLPQYRSIEHWHSHHHHSNNADDHTQQQQQQQQQQQTTNTTTSSSNASNTKSSTPKGEISYKKCFGTCWSKSGVGDGNGASPLLLQYATIYSNDVLHCEKLLQDDCIIGYAKNAIITRWSSKNVESAVKHWMAHFRRWKEQVLNQLPATIAEKNQPIGTNPPPVVPLTKNDANNNKGSTTTPKQHNNNNPHHHISLFSEDEDDEKLREIYLLEEKVALEQAVNELYAAENNANNTFNATKRRKRNNKNKNKDGTKQNQGSDQEDNNDDVFTETVVNDENNNTMTNLSFTANSTSSVSSTLQQLLATAKALKLRDAKKNKNGENEDENNDDDEKDDADNADADADENFFTSRHNPLSNHSATTRLVAFLSSAMFDPSDALNFETVCAHAPMRSQVSFEDQLGVPSQGPEPKIILNTNLTSATPSNNNNPLVTRHNTISTQEFVRNLLQAHPWHPSLLLRVATGSWFLLESNSNLGLATGQPDHMVSSIVGCQELLNNEMMNAMNKVIGSGPEVVGGGAGGKRKPKKMT